MTILKALAICILTVFAAGAVNARETGVIAGVKVETFSSGQNGPRPVVVILSGSKGFASPAYDGIARQFSGAGIDVYLAHLLTADDLDQINSLQGAKQRIDYYEKRRKDWIGNTAKLLTSLGKRREYQGSIGLLGISLGAESAALAISSGAPANAVVLVDGAPSHEIPLAKKPPFKLIWGSQDTVFPLTTGQRFVQEVNKAGGQATLNIFQGAHDFFLKDTKQASEAYKTAIQFFKSELDGD
ncbi:dienelactone hydrolase family protein [Agrobacterium vaccinii]|uniref:dienelactone hydrolase family protein n=1 Tax=Agrobacterium vaccinii TaxID=2735528 RepID=UPI001E3A7FE1|nr:dienelactone hydrolase family protein [Agrobacterium vaccinii]UHS56994.1 dienelactone hydrolase family protein [Agrobacterium vaccinii]